MMDDSTGHFGKVAVLRSKINECNFRKNKSAGQPALLFFYYARFELLPHQ